MNASNRKILQSYIGIDDKNKTGFFEGKIDNLNEIDDILKKKQFLHLYGASGCGKSALASKYALDKCNENKVVVFWFNASDYQLLNLKIMKILTEFDETSPQNWENNDENEIEFMNQVDFNDSKLIKLLKKKINRKSLFMQFLLILDDLKNETILNHFYMNFKSNVKFLITSQQKLTRFKFDSLEIKKKFISINNKITSSDHLVKDIFKLLQILDRDLVSLKFIQAKILEKTSTIDPNEFINKLIEEKVLNEHYYGYSLNKHTEIKNAQIDTLLREISDFFRLRNELNLENSFVDSLILSLNEKFFSKNYESFD